MCGGFIGKVTGLDNPLKQPTYDAQAEAAKASADATSQINQQKAQRKKRAASTVLTSDSQQPVQAKTTLGG